MSRDYIRDFSTVVSIVIAVTVTAVCQTPQPTPSPTPLPKLPEIVQVDRPQVFSYDPAKLAAPFASESAERGSRVIPQPSNARLTVPKGFKVNVYAEGGFRYPRWMALAPNGDVFVADSRANSIIVLRDKDKDGVAEERFVWSDKLAQPFGMAFYKDWFYVANTDSVVRFSYKSGQTQAAGDPERLVELTAGGYNQHWTRNVIFSPDGKKMFVSIGSATNVDVEADPRRAAISVYDTDGKNHKIYAGGLRNPIGLAWNPKTGELWTAVNERDGLGDDLVPDYATSVKEGGWYGWPYSYIGKNRDPRRTEQTDLVDKAIVPDVIFTSHVAALGIQFYTGKMFPKEYQGDAFVAFHGSWNRARLSGYTVIRIPFDDKGKLEANRYENFVSGWLLDENSNEVWGRPVGLLVHSDGSLLIADDGGKKIWRVSYAK
ncbi:MAG: sorbosone dehydrogenase family protein [Pyrinomonadaceae bacterium]